MNLFVDSQDLNAYGRQLAQLLFIGGYQLELCTNLGKRVLFDAWSQDVRTEAGKRGIEVSADQMRWLWESFKTEPATKVAFSHLMVDRSDVAPIKVLPKGSRFSIHLSSIKTGFANSPLHPNVQSMPEAVVTIEDRDFCPAPRIWRALHIRGDVDSMNTES